MSDKNNGFNISKRSFIISIAVIFILMVVCYLLTFIVPAGQYGRIENADGNSIIDTNSDFNYVDGGLPFWKWILSPLLVLAAPGSSTVIAVLLFLLIIGGAFNSLTECNVMKYMLLLLTNKFGSSRYKLMAVVMFFFMAMGSLIGSFEECVPLVPIVVVLSVALGWDEITGVAMSLLAIGCGFAAGVFNPFSVGVAQKLIGLPMFSGVWLRAISFIVIYAVLLFFVRGHAKKIERPVTQPEDNFQKDKCKTRALIAFATILGIGIVCVFLSGFITVLQDYTMIIVAVMFLIAGIVSVLLTGVGGKFLLKTFGEGVLKMLPAVLMILMASSIKFILEESMILDTILHSAVTVAEVLPKYVTILFIYLIVLVMNFFIASGSAKAFILIPLIVPLASAVGIPAQLCVVAYAFGDGFSNVFYPTNPALLISLSLAGVGYGKWAKWSWKFQLTNIIVTSALLVFGLAVGYC